jgi:hypothetical protein
LWHSFLFVRSFVVVVVVRCSDALVVVRFPLGS